MHAHAPHRHPLLLVTLILAVGLALPVRAATLMGDFDGDGSITIYDEVWFALYYGASAGDPNYEPMADLDADGVIGHLDLALFGKKFGSVGGDVDSTPPPLVTSLNDIPDDMNDLLVAPPGGFRVTLDFDAGGGAVVDTSTLSVTNDQILGFLPAGTQLAPFFTVTQTGASWMVPVVGVPPRTTHNLTVSIDDAAGNTANQVYGYAVRDFPTSGKPLGSLQKVFLDFDQDRSLGTEIDFLEDLRHYHLSSTAAPQYETQMRDWIVSEVLFRVHPFFGRNPDGSPGPDAANLKFFATSPAGTYSRLCVGGESQFGSQFLGATLLDVNNVNKAQDDCGIGSAYGVFPQAIDDLWGGDAEYGAVFSPLNPGVGGMPVGEHALDPIVLGVAFDPQTATAPEFARWNEIEGAVHAFAQLIATVAAHETGHLVGLVAHGATPGGLFGGDIGGQTDHNVTTTGSTPAESFVMNEGASFGFSEMTARAGASPPVFRPLSWAYLRDQVVLDASVTGLFPPPELSSVSPNPVVFSGTNSIVITVSGSAFLATPDIELFVAGTSTSAPLLAETFVDPNTLTAAVSPFLVAPGLYDVVVTNPDGQPATLLQGLLVQ